MKKLYLLQHENPGDYAGTDCIATMVVLAKNKKKARELANTFSEGGDEHIITPNCWLDKNITSCQKILLSERDKVILSSPFFPR